MPIGVPGSGSICLNMTRGLGISPSSSQFRIVR